MFPQTRWVSGRTSPSVSDAKAESVGVLRHKIDLDFLCMKLSKTKYNLLFLKGTLVSFPLDRHYCQTQSQSIKMEKKRRHYIKPMKNTVSI